MTKQQHDKALKCLKNIDNLKLKKHYSLKGGNIRYEFIHQLIDMDDMTMIISGTLEQFNSNHHTKESIFLVIALYDSNNQNMSFTPVQHDQYIKKLKLKIVK